MAASASGRATKRRDGSVDRRQPASRTPPRAPAAAGQNGNAINVFRAADVIVRDNRIRSAAFSAIRGNAASNIQIIGNDCAALDEVAMLFRVRVRERAHRDNAIDGAAPASP